MSDKTAQPRQKIFDPWNSSSTGHQRAEMRQASGWAAIRQIKSNSQFRDGGKGGQRLVHPTDEQTQDRHLQKSVMDMLQRPGTMGSASKCDSGHDDTELQSQLQPRRLFDGVMVYVNGSTYPMISDHKLKMLLCQNGATMSLGLARRKVTHVILGKGLAGGKLDKEVKRVKGCGVHYVGVEW